MERKISALGQLVGTFMYTWRIQDFSKIPLANGERYSSEYFLCGSDENLIDFCIYLYAGGYKPRDHQFVAVYLHTYESKDEEEDTVTKNVSAKFAVTFRTSCGKVVRRQETSCCTRGPGSEYGWHRFVKRDSLLSQIPDGVVDVFVEVDYCAGLVTDSMGEVTYVPEPSFTWGATENFLSFLETGKHSDVAIRVEETDVPAHKFVLASRSNVFAAMFEHDATEESTTRIDVTHFDIATVKSMLSFLYSGRVPNMDVPLALELLRAAVKYCLDDLKRFCSNFLLANMDGENVGKILVAADVHQATEMRKVAVNFLCESISVNFEKHKALLKERPELLCDIICRIAEIWKPPSIRL